MGKLRNAFDKVNWGDVAIRTVKTFVQVFIGLQGGARLVDWLDGTVPVDTNGLRIAAAGAAVAAVTYVWNVLLQAFSTDPTPGSRAAARLAFARGGLGARVAAAWSPDAAVMQRHPVDRESTVIADGPSPEVEPR